MDIHKKNKSELSKFEDSNSLVNLKENILNDTSNYKEYDNSKSLKEKYFIMDNFNNKDKINYSFKPEESMEYDRTISNNNDFILF